MELLILCLLFCVVLAALGGNLLRMFLFLLC